MTVADLGRGAAIIAVLLLAGCATDQTAYYAPPPGLTPDRAVSIIGSKDPKSPLQSSEYHLVWQVDGQRVRDSATRWDQPLLVTAGAPHRLSLAYGWGGISGGTEIELTGKPGTTVVVEGAAVDPTARPSSGSPTPAPARSSARSTRCASAGSRPANPCRW